MCFGESCRNGRVAYYILFSPSFVHSVFSLPLTIFSSTFSLSLKIFFGETGVVSNQTFRWVLPTLVKRGRQNTNEIPCVDFPFTVKPTPIYYYIGVLFLSTISMHSHTQEVLLLSQYTMDMHVERWKISWLTFVWQFYTQFWERATPAIYALLVEAYVMCVCKYPSLPNGHIRWHNFIVSLSSSNPTRFLYSFGKVMWALQTTKPFSVRGNHLDKMNDCNSKHVRSIFHYSPCKVLLELTLLKKRKVFPPSFLAVSCIDNITNIFIRYCYKTNLDWSGEI